MELYVHLPFCRQKCRYCDFASFPGLESGMDRYVSALLAEAEQNAGEVSEPLNTVYFGGGTPSLLPLHLLSRLIRGLRERLPLDAVREWTLEANPGTLTAEWLDTARENGVSRLSLGMQAGQDWLLKALGRIHDVKQAEESVRMAREAGFQNLNLDLIFGLPGQTREDWRQTLALAFSLNPEHLSAYGLIPEEGTSLFADLESGRLRLPEPEEERAMYEDLLTLAAAHGYLQYEISNFAKPGFECRHNIGYWTQVPYLGLGLSAASMLRVSHTDQGMKYLRRTNTADWQDYLNGMESEHPAYTEEQWISPSEARFETLMLGLRMNRGVAESAFRALHGVSLESCYGEKLKKLRQENLLEQRDGCWRLTRKGMDLQNAALVELMD